LDVVILGAGSLGQTFAVLLARHQASVILVGTPESVNRLVQKGIVLDGKDQAQVPVYDMPASIKDVKPGQIVASTELAEDISIGGVIACTKAHQLRDALDRISSLRPQLVIGFQNGLTKDAVLSERFGQDVVAGAVTIIGADRQEDGTIYISGRGATFIGPLSTVSSRHLEESAQFIITALNEANYPAEWRSDIVSVEWSKAVMASATFGIAVLTQSTMGKIFSREPWTQGFLDLLEDAASVADSLQIPLCDLPGFPVQYFRTESREVITRRLRQASESLATVRVSMLQDVMAGRSLEVDEVVGSLIAHADSVHLAVPRLRFTYRILRGFSPLPE
jgi:2-dehydropantoate 2-reductase